MQKSQMFIIILQKYAHTFVYFDIFLYLCSRKRQKQFLGNQKRRTHHRYAFSPRGFERKQLIRILCEHKCALIFTLVADDLTNRCWVLTKTRLRSQKSATLQKQIRTRSYRTAKGLQDGQSPTGRRQAPTGLLGN